MVPTTDAGDGTPTSTIADESTELRITIERQPEERR